MTDRHSYSNKQFINELSQFLKPFVHSLKFIELQDLTLGRERQTQNLHEDYISFLESVVMLGIKGDLSDRMKHMLTRVKLIEAGQMGEGDKKKIEKIQALYDSSVQKIVEERKKAVEEKKKRDEKIVVLQETVKKHMKTIENFRKEQMEWAQKEVKKDESEQVKKQMEENAKLSDMVKLQRKKFIELYELYTRDQKVLAKLGVSIVKPEEIKDDKHIAENQLLPEENSFQTEQVVNVSIIPEKNPQDSAKKIEERQKSNVVSDYKNIFKIMREHLRVPYIKEFNEFKFFKIGECKGYSELKRMKNDVFILQENVSNNAPNLYVGLFINQLDFDWEYQSVFQFHTSFKLATFQKQVPTIKHAIELKFGNKNNEIIIQEKGRISTSYKIELNRPFCVFQKH
ncbi:hypothetical protein FGO68_gene14552 [Halteria grandinella]|uniref:Uncharacterized protein n=1 Tax=Halteria grandinella TaxID=5974 RepID=A0A8J8NPG1_HALGN|nr:hypothetical protein FGO68_gene14552 [Halteria grandinella]